MKVLMYDRLFVVRLHLMCQVGFISCILNMGRTIKIKWKIIKLYKNTNEFLGAV